MTEDGDKIRAISTNKDFSTIEKPDVNKTNKTDG